MSWWRRRHARVLALPIFGAVLAGAAPYPVQVWKQSDDGLTNKLAAAIKDAVKRSTHLTLSTSHKPGMLYLKVSPALWEEVGDHTRVTYFVHFARTTEESDSTAKSTGSCWDYQMEHCAAEIVKEAEAAARK
jgi:hypothetical protein